MKRVTAILLAMVLMLSACAAPSGDSGENSAGGGSSGSESFVSSSESESFVSSSAAQAETEQDAGSSAAQAEAAQGIGGEEAVTNAGRQPLVILEQQDEDYRAAAEHKKTKAADGTGSPLRAAGSGGSWTKSSRASARI